MHAIGVPNITDGAPFCLFVFVEVGFDGGEVSAGGEAEVFELLTCEFFERVRSDAFEDALGADFVADGLAVFIPEPDVFGRAVEKFALSAIWDGAEKLAAELGFGI